MQIDTHTEFKNMNVRAEKSGEEVGEGAVDLTFEATLGIDATADLFGTASQHARLHLASMYADKGQAPEVTVPGIKEIVLSTDFDPVKVEFEPGFIPPMTMDRCRLDKIRITPEFAQEFSVKFRVQAHPTAEQVGHLYEMQGRSLRLRAFQQQGELPFGQRDAEEESEDEGAEA